MDARVGEDEKQCVCVCAYRGRGVDDGFRPTDICLLPPPVPPPDPMHIVNADPLILPGTTLALALWDHQCSPGLGLRGFIQTLRDPTKQPLVGILDGGCSGACRAVADISRYYNLVTVSGVAASPVLSDKYQYPMVRVPS